MTSENLTHRNESAIERPFSKVVSLQPRCQSVVVNNAIGIIFDDNKHISFVCDKRTHIEREGMLKSSKSPPVAEIGCLTLSFQKGKKIYIGDASPILIERISPADSLPVIVICDTRPISVEPSSLNLYQLKQRLAESLKP